MVRAKPNFFSVFQPIVVGLSWPPFSSGGELPLLLPLLIVCYCYDFQEECIGRIFVDEVILAAELVDRRLLLGSRALCCAASGEYCSHSRANSARPMGCAITSAGNQ